MAVALAPAAASDGRHRGVSWVAGSEISEGDVAVLREFGIDHIVQTPFGWQRGHDSPEVRLITDGRIYWGERDVGLEVTTRLARKHGIRTLLKPHLWLTRPAPGKWRADIAMASEDDWRRWFASYREFLLHYARLAERLDVEGLAVGTELHATVRARPDEWRRLIAEVRQVYAGELTYSANWYREFEEVPFWDRLDYVGIQAYFPLADGDRPGQQQLRAGWGRHLPAIEAVARRYGKPVLFTEIGYRSAADAAVEPWRWPERDRRVEPDPETQARAYQAFFESVWNRPWFAGAYVWKWYPHRRGGGTLDADFTPQGKPALEMLRRWYRSPAAAVTTPQ